MSKKVATRAVVVAVVMLVGGPLIFAAETAAPTGHEISGVVDAKASLGVQISDFTLREISGKDYSLSDFSDHPVVVVMFLGYECPLVQLYASRIVRLEEQFRSQGVAVIGINSNQ